MFSLRDQVIENGPNTSVNRGFMRAVPDTYAGSPAGLPRDEAAPPSGHAVHPLGYAVPIGGRAAAPLVVEQLRGYLACGVLPVGCARFCARRRGEERGRAIVCPMGIARDGKLPTRAEVASAALLSLPFTVYLIVLTFVAPPTETNWERADPILGILPRAPTLWLVPVLGLLVAAAWPRVARPSRADLARSARFALLGLGAAALAVGALRFVTGPHMPSFVPSEESAGPGYLLSMTAGFGEELLFRFMMLPLLVGLLARWTTRDRAVVVAVVATALAFALLHDAGPGPFSATHFVTRFVFPGCIMSLAFLVVEPSFLVTAHGAAHVLMPMLFLA